MALGVLVLILAGLCVACLLRMLDDMLLLHNWDNNYLFCSRTRRFAILTMGTAIVH